MEKLRQAFRGEDKLVIIDRKEYFIFYSCTYKYPLLTVEYINKNTGKTIGERFITKDIKNQWRPDMVIPKECRLYVKHYRKYMEYGGSNGHNAPADYHKTNLNTYLSTFKLSNHCPQEVVFNAGLWVLLEIWCKNLKNKSNLENIIVYTGSIPSKKNIVFDDNIVLNIPSHMFKIVTAKDTNDPDKLFIACFLMPNQPPKEKIHKLYKLYKHMVSLKYISDKANINIFKLFRYYSGFKDYMKIHNLKHKIRIDIHIEGKLIRYMNSALAYGHIIYSKTLQELEESWKQVVQNGFDDEYHRLYYTFCKRRIKRNETNEYLNEQIKIFKNI